ncbi:restriction endonuclease [Mycolicibacterium mucogenicum]|uniref:restriction endonuclease n=1 Tax=Mycolicibacterium TaxID=1866885 RepID=UPI00226A3399|nr:MULTISPECIES: restriction endonuclease [Mycolicibacterium]MCX8561079.1 restriction endonuclease [Mycolicibacterium mucogenicum]
MARVEWTRTSPDDVEAVVGMLLCSQSPNAVRVRPSQGDGGIDIFIPGDAGWGKEREVWQVKRYCTNLSSTEKRAIKRSFRRVVDTAEAEGWQVTEWHLIMPLDLTTQNLGWLDDYIGERDFPCETHGLLLCDTLAARYPNIIDYYLRDGRERLQAHLDSLTNVLSGRKNRGSGEPLAAADVYSDLTSIYKGLNACDPFYKYWYQVSDEPPVTEKMMGEENLVAAHALCQDEVWVTVKVFARMLAAHTERPVTWNLQFAIPEADEELREQFEKFVDYGAPITMPAGTVTGSLDLPGGLGGDFARASMEVITVPRDDQSDDDVLLIGIIAPDSDAVLASTRMRRNEFSSGRVGNRTVLADEANLFTVEMLFRDGAVSGSVECTLSLGVSYKLGGRRPSEVADGLNVLASFHAPNRVAFGSAYGPPNFSIFGPIPNELTDERGMWAPICKALALIQDHTTVQLRMPEEMERDEALGILDAAKLLSGQPTTGTAAGQSTITHTPESEIIPQLHRTSDFLLIKDLEISLGGQAIIVGKQAVIYRGRYIEIGDQRSKIEVSGNYVSFVYRGELEVGRVLARYVEPDALTPAAD